MGTTLHIPDEQAMGQVARYLLEHYPDDKVFLLEGDLGAGKTTLVKCICKDLAVKGHAVSPTFSLVNEYISGDGRKLFHIDLYRIEDETELYDIGIEDYLYGDSYCFVEWPEKLGKLLPDNCVSVRISAYKNGREVTINRKT